LMGSAMGMPILSYKNNKRRLTLVDGLGHGDADPQTVGRLRALEGRQVLAVGQLEPLEDERVGAGDDVLRLAQVVLQDLALVPAQVAWLFGAGAAVARREGEVAEGRDGELGAAVGKVVGRPDHGERRWNGRGTRVGCRLGIHNYELRLRKAHLVVDVFFTEVCDLSLSLSFYSRCDLKKYLSFF